MITALIVSILVWHFCGLIAIAMIFAYNYFAEKYFKTSDQVDKQDLLLILLQLLCLGPISILICIIVSIYDFHLNYSIYKKNKP